MSDFYEKKIRAAIVSTCPKCNGELAADQLVRMLAAAIFMLASVCTLLIPVRASFLAASTFLVESLSSFAISKDVSRLSAPLNSSFVQSFRSVVITTAMPAIATTTSASMNHACFHQSLFFRSLTSRFAWDISGESPLDSAVLLWAVIIILVACLICVIGAGILDIAKRWPPPSAEQTRSPDTSTTERRNRKSVPQRS